MRNQERGPLSPGERRELERLQRRVQQRFNQAQHIADERERERFLDAGQADDDRRMELVGRYIRRLREQP